MRKLARKIVSKKRVITDNLFIRNISKSSKTKFQSKAKTLGYKPREYFELIVKGL